MGCSAGGVGGAGGGWGNGNGNSTIGGSRLGSGGGGGVLDSRVFAHNTGRLLRGEKGAFFAGALSSPARRALPHVARLANDASRLSAPSNTPSQSYERGVGGEIHQSLGSSPDGIARLKLNHNHVIQNQEREATYQSDIEEIHEDDDDDEIVEEAT